MSENQPTQPVQKVNKESVLAASADAAARLPGAAQSEAEGQQEPAAPQELAVRSEPEAVRSEPEAVRSEPIVRSETAARSEPESAGVEGDERSIRVFWREYGRETVRGALKKIDANGRHMILVDVVLVGLYANILAFSNLGAVGLGSGEALIYLLPLLFLVFSLLFAGGIFLLDKPDIELRSSRVVRAAYMDAVKNKLLFLRTALLLLALAVV
ncbi:MAG: hypothetical protein EHM39_03695, partial [Chloroflexi bacterium]